MRQLVDGIPCILWRMAIKFSLASIYEYQYLRLHELALSMYVDRRYHATTTCMCTTHARNDMLLRAIATRLTNSFSSN